MLIWIKNPAQIICMPQTHLTITHPSADFSHPEFIALRISDLRKELRTGRL
jgi:hypothetical protein